MCSSLHDRHPQRAATTNPAKPNAASKPCAILVGIAAAPVDEDADIEEAAAAVPVVVPEVPLVIDPLIEVAPAVPPVVVDEPLPLPPIVAQ